MKRILVIDDDQSIGNLLGTALRSRFEVMVANDGQSGMDTALRMQPHLVLCDINMLGMNGYATLSKLREHPTTCSTPCILMTGDASPSGMRQGMELGADDYLPKPFQLQELFAAVDARLTKHELVQREAEVKFRKLQRTLATSIPNQLLAPMDDLVVMTELMSKGHRHFEPEDIVSMSRDAHRVAIRVRQKVENCLLLAELMLLAEEPARSSRWRERRLVHVLDIVEPAVVQKATQMARGNDLKLSFSYCQARIYPRSLDKIVEEVLDNAFKYSPPATPVGVRVFPEKNHSIIEISDRGPGIAPEKVSKLGAFVRIEQKLVEANGCGLGLAISKGLAELNDGQLTIHRGERGGTVVRIILPTLDLAQN